MQIIREYHFFLVKFYFTFTIVVFLNHPTDRNRSFFELCFLYPLHTGVYYLINKVVYFGLPRIAGFVSDLTFRFSLEKKTARFHFTNPNLLQDPTIILCKCAVYDSGIQKNRNLLPKDRLGSCPGAQDG